MSKMDNIVFHLVDDNDIDIAVNSKLLQLSQISGEIYTYTSAVRFLGDIDTERESFSNRHNVVLLDIMMPQVNGFECLDRLRELPGELKKRFTIFMLSSSIDRNDIRRAESYEMVQKVLEKPLDIYLLKKLLQDILDL